MLLRKWITSFTPFWLAMSLLFSTGLSFYGLHIAFSSRDVIQDDARQHLFWMAKFKDPELFRSDLIADYYRSVAPSGFTALYRAVSQIGVDPLVFNKVLPLILGCIATVYCFLWCLRIYPVPLAGFVASVLLNENLWTREDLASGTPRSFAYPLFLAFLYYLRSGSKIASLATLALQALIFPPVALISIALLLFRIAKDKERTFAVAGILLAVILLLPYAIASSEFGPVVSATQAKMMDAFSPEGREPFFYPDPWRFWITGWHSGFLPYGMRPPLIWAGLLLPLLIWRKREELTEGASLLLQVLIASTVLFLAAHLFLFTLYNPGRYTQHTLPIVMAVASGISLTMLLELVLQRAKQWIGIGLALAGAIVLVVQFEKTCAYGYGFQTYLVGKQPALYEFFATRPKNIMVASLSREADNIPVFAQRSILVGREYSLPYHLGYFRQIQQRVHDLTRALGSSDPKALRRFVRAYRVDYILLEKVGAQATNQGHCVEFQNESFLVLNGKCL